jgi:hypothetical protein
MNNLRGANCFNEDTSYNFWYIFTLILISYIIYIFNDKNHIKII